MEIRDVLRASPRSARVPRNVAASAATEGGTGVRVCVIGPGTRFLSGLTVYTVRLANALAQSHQVSVLLMRQLLPMRLYPGADRVGHDLARLQFHPRVR